MEACVKVCVEVLYTRTHITYTDTLMCLVCEGACEGGV